ncbi:hypothetical protein [Gorillibacterium massiliense]|uniref:hypothetical protein n=1 Tax=Gorillibacterium massiliense TaxID=1280390 RepID=UPI000592811A|nr:hypothetical protein [Gorillibacterium massiliense]
MSKIKPNLPLVIGLFLFSVSQIVRMYGHIPDTLHKALMLTALVFELWGLIMFARSPEIKNSKLRQWKLRLIGKGQK